MRPSDDAAKRREGAADESPADAEELSELRDLLVADRQRTSERISALERDVASIIEGTRQSATDDEHDPEGSTIAFERSQAGALLAAAEGHLADLDDALLRIDQGSYGRCGQCGERIARERLLARPAARTCITCASRR